MNKFNLKRNDYVCGSFYFIMYHYIWILFNEQGISNGERK